ncbi:hypothetical protein ACOJBO_03275 [Rhizobium beringeri]
MVFTDALLGFALSVQANAVLAHPRDSLGYTALILALYAIVIGLNFCAVCTFGIGLLYAAFVTLRTAFGLSLFLLKQPVRLVLIGYFAVVAVIIAGRRAVVLAVTGYRSAFRLLSHSLSR